MNTNIMGAAIATLSIGVSGTALQAQDSNAFTWEAEVELGFDSVISSNTAGNELTDTYGVFDVSAEWALSERVRLFSALTAESVTDATSDRAFEDIGLYVGELGLAFDLGTSTTVALGKVAPSFGTAWDDTVGFYGGTLAEDYELAEMIGALADVELADGSVLSFGVFYADDTVLSESWGTNRGRNSSAAGGAGNTGQLDNFSAQWAKVFGDTNVHIGARFLSAGTGDVSDETGIVAGIGHTAGAWSVYGEVAAFDGFGGGADDAVYASVNAAYGIGDWTISSTYAYRDLDSAGDTDLLSVGAEYELQNGMVLGGALAYVDDAGIQDTRLGMNLIIPLGS